MGLSLLFSAVLYHIADQELHEALHHQYHSIVDNDHDADNDYDGAMPDDEADRGSSHYLQDLVYFNIAVFIGATVLSYALAKRTLRPIEIAHQAQARFTAEASHELRTPLAAIRADTEATLMGRDKSAQVLRRAMQENLQDIQKLEQLTERLLALSRYQNQGVQVHEPVDLDSIVQTALKQFRQRVRAKHLVVTVDARPLQVTGDAQAVSQVMTIVLDNAIKYSNQGGSIAIGLHQEARAAVLTVTDTGIGISPDDLPHIFERFYRSRRAMLTKNQTPGFGLGLSLARDIVTAHHGVLTVMSEEQSGTTVTLKLPIE